MQTNISVESGKIKVTGPYSETNNERWRNLGGKFIGGGWVLPDNDTVREVIAGIFGAKSEEVEVLVPLFKVDGRRNAYQIGGYVLAQRRGRDRAVDMPDGVSLAAGGFPRSGGSVKNPSVNASDDTVFRLVCRKSFAEANKLDLAVATQPAVEI